MSHNDFVKEIQENLKQQKVDASDGRNEFLENRFLDTAARRNWDLLVNSIREELAEINKGLVGPLLVYSQPTDDEFSITNNAKSLNVVVKREPSGDLVYRGTSAGGIFRARAAGHELEYSWERTMSTPSIRMAFGSIGVKVSLDELGKLLIRSVVTP